MNQITPIFKTNGSFSRSILSYNDDLEIDNNSPVSIFAIAQKHNLKELVVIEDSFIPFPKLYHNCNDNKIKLKFGINFIICDNNKDRDENSLSTNNKISILMKNSQGYEDLIRIYDYVNADESNFYFGGRLDWKSLQNFWTKNLELVIPPFDGFLFKNLLYNGKCVVNFGKIKPIMTFANMNLPYNDVLNNFIKIYSEHNKYDLKEVHPIFYYKNKDFKQYSCFRSMDQRNKFNVPNIDYFCSDWFSFEKYLEKIC